MKLVIFSIVLNHHQACVADELYSILGNDFCFVELSHINEKKGSIEDFSERSYLLQAWKSNDNYNKALHFALNSEVCIFSGVGSLPFQKERLKKNLLSFDMSERWLKKGICNLFSPTIRKMYLNYVLNGWGNKPLYKLCSSAFAAQDQHRLHTFKNKCFKWGYFTKVDNNFEVVAPKKGSPNSEITPIMWCARFLKLKHPELPVLLAAKLKSEGYRFRIDMFGSGEELDSTKELISELNVEDYVKLCGNRSNSEILLEMKNHYIFLFTSDKNEGWGAVANESMANGCALVISDAIGSAPYLIQDGVNGFQFKSRNLLSLTEKVEWLLNHPIELNMMRENAYITMRDIWSPSHAANNLLLLIEDLKKGRNSSILEGPCSIA